MQDDDFANPAFLWVDYGTELWEDVNGAAGKACSSCHGDAEDSMKGVGTSYPVYSAELGKPINLEQRINKCRVDNMQAKAWKYESRELLGMTAYVKSQSRGMPAARATRYVLRQLSRGQRGQHDPRQSAEPGAEQRFPAVSPEVAKGGLPAPQVPRLQQAGTGRALRLRFGRVREPGGLPVYPRAQPAGGSAGSQDVNSPFFGKGMSTPERGCGSRASPFFYRA
jgi:hypothetical protein